MTDELQNASMAAIAAMGVTAEEAQEAVAEEAEQEHHEEEEPEMDPTVVSVGEDEEDFTFQPIRSGRKLQD